MSFLSRVSSRLSPPPPLSIHRSIPQRRACSVLHLQPLAHSHARPVLATFDGAPNSLRICRRKHTGVKPPRPERGAITLEDFRLAILNNDAPTILPNYEYLARDGAFQSRDTRDLVKALQTLAKGTRRDPKPIREHILNVALLYKTRQLPPSENASTRLLACLRDLGEFDQALDLWAWLETQGGHYVGTTTYGVAIETLVAAGQDANTCESTYDRAFDASHQVFNRYLMSPNAVLPDPTRQIVTKGTSVSLLQGIATARFTHGNWRDGYLAIESAIRLHPFQVPPSILHLIIRHRPLEEMLRMLGLICYSGNRINRTQLPIVLKKLVREIRSDLRADTDRLYHAFRCAEAQIESLQCCIATGQQIPPAAASLVMKGVMGCVPHQHNALPPEKQAVFHFLTQSLNDAVLEVFSKMGMRDEVPALKTLSAALEADNTRLAMQAFDSYLEGLPAGTQNRLEQVLAAVVRFQNEEMAIHAMSSFTRGEPRYSGLEVLRIMIAQARTREEVSFCSKLIPSAQLPSDDTLALQSEMEQRAKLPSEQVEIFDQIKPRHGSGALDRQERRISTLIGKLRAMASALEDRKYINLQHETPTWPTLSDSLCNFPDTWHQSLYQDMHISPLSKDVSPEELSSQPPELGTISGTGMSIQRARFECFKTINNVLLLAEDHEIWSQPQGEKPGNATDRFPQTEADWRKRILNLRNAVAPSGTLRSSSPNVRQLEGKTKKQNAHASR